MVEVMHRVSLDLVLTHNNSSVITNDCGCTITTFKLFGNFITHKTTCDREHWDYCDPRNRDTRSGTVDNQRNHSELHQEEALVNDNHCHASSSSSTTESVNYGLVDHHGHQENVLADDHCHASSSSTESVNNGPVDDRVHENVDNVVTIYQPAAPAGTASLTKKKRGEERKPRENPASIKVTNEIKRKAESANELPTHILDKIRSLPGCENVVPERIFCKYVFASDMKPDQQRLTMPREHVKPSFLLDNEKQELHTLVKKPLKVVYEKVTQVANAAITSEVVEGTLDMARRPKVKPNEIEPPPSWKYCLQGSEWNKVVSGRDIQVGDAVQVWSFRYGVEGDNNLGLAVVKISKAELETLVAEENPAAPNQKRRRTA